MESNSYLYIINVDMFWYILICRVSVSIYVYICIHNIHAVDCLFSVHIKDHQNVWSWLVSQASYCQLWLQSWTKGPPFSTKILSVTHALRRPTFESTAYMLEASGLPRPCSGMRIIENPWDILGPLGPGPWRPWSKSQRLICSTGSTVTEPSPDSGSLHWPSWQQEGRLTPCGRVGRFDCRPANIERNTGGRWTSGSTTQSANTLRLEVQKYPEIISQPF